MSKPKRFSLRLINSLKRPIVAITLISIAYVIIMNSINHRYEIIIPLVIALSIAKTILLVRSVLTNLQKLINICYSVQQLLTVFGTLILLTIFSFATDFTCIYHADKNSFVGFNPSYSYILSIGDSLYFSAITFATVGYGDISPVSGPAKFIVMLEIALSFLILFFALTNVSKIHQNEH